MKRLHFQKSDISKGHLILVNPTHPYTDQITREQLTLLAPESLRILLERQAARMLSEAIAFLGGAQDIVPVSGYRTLKEQEAIFYNSMLEHGEAFTRSYVAIPGCSEHQTGLAVDLAKSQDDLDAIRPEFPYEGIWGSFRRYAAQYGFIERYPAGKEKITRIAHEPWHFRYVGYPHSALMKESGLTLEEYLACLKNYLYEGRHYLTSCHNRNFEIFYVALSSEEKRVIEIPEHVPYQASGNNEDGIVVTLWRDRL